MFGSKIFGKKEVVSEILDHTVFKEREGSLTRGLMKAFGQLYIRVLGWPVSEPRIYHSKLVRLLQPSPSDSILDVGCGPGVHALEIASRYGPAITGVDIDESDIRFADRVKEVNRIDNCRFICMDATDLRFAPESFNKVICMAVLEHIEDDNLAIENIARVLRKGGVLVGAVPNERRSRFKPDSFQRNGDPKGHGHVREGYSVQSIENSMFKNGLQLVGYEYVSGPIQNLMLMVEERTNRYMAFPFTYPVAYLSSRLSNQGTGILFKAVKKSNGDRVG
jgi:2-polyprenyl-3-methyl-5-hydroxy-6-metoxy-1,4-benzoquinol methylase